MRKSWKATLVIDNELEAAISAETAAAQRVHESRSAKEHVAASESLRLANDEVERILKLRRMAKGGYDVR